MFPLQWTSNWLGVSLEYRSWFSRSREWERFPLSNQFPSFFPAAGLHTAPWVASSEALCKPVTRGLCYYRLSAWHTFRYFDLWRLRWASGIYILTQDPTLRNTALQSLCSAPLPTLVSYAGFSFGKYLLAKLWPSIYSLEGCQTSPRGFSPDFLCAVTAIGMLGPNTCSGLIWKS